MNKTQIVERACEHILELSIVGQLLRQRRLVEDRSLERATRVLHVTERRLRQAQVVQGDNHVTSVSWLFRPTLQELLADLGRALERFNRSLVLLL